MTLPFKFIKEDIQYFTPVLYIFYLTASLNSFPGLKAGTLEAAISISSPV